MAVRLTNAMQRAIRPKRSRLRKYLRSRPDLQIGARDWEDDGPEVVRARL